MEVGKVCKGTSIILFILDFIGSIVLGNELGRYDFNWGVFFYGIVVGFIFCLLIYAIGEIIDQFERLNTNTYNLYHLLKKIAPKEEKKTEPKKSYFSSSATNVQKTADGGWICKKCGSKNGSTDRFCMGCGAYK